MPERLSRQTDSRVRLAAVRNTLESVWREPRPRQSYSSQSGGRQTESKVVLAAARRTPEYVKEMVKRIPAADAKGHICQVGPLTLKVPKLNRKHSLSALIAEIREGYLDYLLSRSSTPTGVSHVAPLSLRLATNPQMQWGSMGGLCPVKDLPPFAGLIFSPTGSHYPSHQFKNDGVTV
ncbi:hypothetical protein PoB_001310500 [Plakobranchus ocellatus]|uniref:Uncharacterized protein n=1 Tax=Plakobranchus ocellatus TaxID=259542 RepID=A0AAV3YTS8_9GAST|nr:hypothetical protein PoB_001310500 [Plakobranchus ocellatus]